MKYTKFLAAFFGIAALASCSNNDDKPVYNTAEGVTVCMEVPDTAFLESEGLVNVPFTVKGTSNGMITVTFSIKEQGAIEDAHFFITSKTVNVEAGAEGGELELVIVDDYDLNDPRQFIVHIENVKGAQAGNPQETIVEIEDNDNQPYQRLAGEWEMYYGDPEGKNQTMKTIRVNAFGEHEFGFNQFYTVTGIVGSQPTVAAGRLNLRATFSHKATSDTDPGVSSMDIAYDQDLRVEVGGNTYNGFLGYLYNLSIGTSGSVTFTTTEDFQEMIVTQSPLGDAAIFTVFYVTDQGLYGYSDNIEWVTKLKRP